MALIAALAACADDDLAAASNRVLSPQAAPTAQGGPAAQPIMTMAQVDRYFAAKSALSQAARTDHMLAVFEAPAELESEAAHARRIAANAEAAAIISHAGTTPDEYAHMARLLPAASVAYSMLLSGPVTRVPRASTPRCSISCGSTGRRLRRRPKLLD